MLANLCGIDDNSMNFFCFPGCPLPLHRRRRLPRLYHRARHRQVHHLCPAVRALWREAQVLDLPQPHRGRRVLRVI